MFTEPGLALPKALGCAETQSRTPEGSPLPTIPDTPEPGSRLVLATGAAGGLLSRPSSQGPRHTPAPHAPPPVGPRSRH